MHVIKFKINSAAHLCQIGRDEAQVLTVDVKQLVNNVSNSTLGYKHQIQLQYIILLYYMILVPSSRLAPLTLFLPVSLCKRWA